MKKKGDFGDFGDFTEEGAKGNTKSRPNQLLSWFFTFNNYTKSDIDNLLEIFGEICDRYIFEEEVGEQGTPHLQGVIFLKKKMRWSEFGLSPKINWQSTKKEPKAIRYCQKEYHWDGKPIYHKGITLDRNDFEIPVKNTYLLHIEDIIKNDKNNKRSIYWFWSKKGECGKTTIMKYLNDRYGANIIIGGTYKDIMNLASGCTNKEIFIFNIPKSMKTTKDLYIGIETLKDGIISNMKSYKCETHVFKRPIILVFANYEPKVEKLSSDRWRIHQIDYMGEVKKVGV